MRQADNQHKRDAPPERGELAGEGRPASSRRRGLRRRGHRPPAAHWLPGKRGILAAPGSDPPEHVCVAGRLFARGVTVVRLAMPSRVSRGTDTLGPGCPDAKRLPAVVAVPRSGTILGLAARARPLSLLARGRGDYRPVRLRAAGHIRVVLSRLGALTVLALSLALRLCLQLLLLLSP